MKYIQSRNFFIDDIKKEFSGAEVWSPGCVVSSNPDHVVDDDDDDDEDDDDPGDVSDDQCKINFWSKFPERRFNENDNRKFLKMK